MLVASHTNCRTKCFAGFGDTVIVGSDYNLTGRTFLAAFVHMLNHGLAIDIAQGLTG
jgi:hypothetical protein